MHKTNLVTSAALGVGALLLAACSSSGGGSAEASEKTSSKRAETQANEQASIEARFCQGANKLYAQFQAGGPTPENGQEMFEAARSLKAPHAIATDWQVTLDALEPLVNPAATPAVDLATAQETGVLDRVGNYINETCNVG